MPAPAETVPADTAIAARDHIPALDGLRGIAILLVIPHNADIFSHAAAWLWPFALVAHAGWLGVQLFFVLSGFLITRNLIDSRGASNYFRAFFARRMLRIFPLYYLTLFVALVLLPHLVAFTPQALESQRHQVWLWTFLSNWSQPFGADVTGFSHFWSLAVEEQFYLVWPFVVLWMPPGKLLHASLAVALVALVTRSLMLHLGAGPEELYTFTICRMDALALGAAIAALGSSRAWIAWLASFQRRVLIAIVIALGITAVFSHTYSTFDPRTLLFGQTVLAAAFALLIACLSVPSRETLSAFIRRLLEARWLRTVGRVSFAMYVFHLPILTVLGPWLGKALAFTGSALPLCYALAALGLSFIAGWLSYHLLEKHFLKLKSRVAPSASSAASAA